MKAFFANINKLMKFSLQQIQQQIGGDLAGSGGIIISGVNSLELAKPGDITFAENKRYLELAQKTQASAIVVSEDFPVLERPGLLRVANPKQSFIAIMSMFARKSVDFSGIHPAAVISEQSVHLGKDVAIAAVAVIGDNVTIGDATSIESGTHIGNGVKIGKHCQIGPNVTILSDVTIGNNVIIHAGTVIGGEGFGYFWDGRKQQKIPQLGGVQIDDDVEIGCNSCIDRATFGLTRIRQGVKIDNLVQIAHNNDIGEHSIIVSHVGLSGSVTLGKRVTLAGQVGVADHVHIGDGATAAARTGVSKDIQAGQVVWGAPNRPIKQVMKEFACIARLPRLFEQVKQLAKRLEKLEKNG